MTCRSSHRKCAAKKDVLKKFCKFHRKTHVIESLFSKVVGLKDCNFTKKRLQHRCFPVKFAKFLRTPILKIIFERLLPDLKKTRAAGAGEATGAQAPPHLNYDKKSPFQLFYLQSRCLVPSDTVLKVADMLSNNEWNNK